MNEDDLAREIPDSFGEKYRRVIDLVERNFSGHDRDHVEDIRELANQLTV
jgi:hypothetical protein